MRAVALGAVLVFGLSAPAIAAESPKKAYSDAVFCAATPLALRDAPSPDGYGGRPDPQTLAKVIEHTRALAVTAGGAVGADEAKVDADINRQTVDLTTSLNGSSLDERHKLQTMLGKGVILCAMGRK